MSTAPKDITTNTLIYILKCPITLQIRYIGKTSISLRDRLYQHMSIRPNDKSYRANWIRSLKNMGIKPIVEEVDNCPWNESQELEIYWISKLKLEGCKLVNGTIGGEGTKGRIVRKESILKQKATQRSMSKKVYQYSMRGKFLREWSCYIEIEEVLNLEIANISSCCYGRRRSCGNFRWSLEYKEKLDVYTLRQKPVLQYDLKGNYIAEHESAKKAGLLLNTTSSHIGQCCKGKRGTAGKFKWKYKDMSTDKEVSQDDIRMEISVGNLKEELS